MPFGTAHCSVKSFQHSVSHCHHEKESFYIIKGSGYIICNNVKSEIKAGDLIIFEQFDKHAIYNDCDDELHFITLWWEDVKNQKQSSEEYSGETVIFTAPPTPNGNLHLGHLSGPYSGADIFKRGLLLEGRKAYHSCGRDDNQTYVLKKAWDEGRTPDILAEDYSNQILETLKLSDIEIDHFENPLLSTTHDKITCELFSDLYDKGFIYSKKTAALFCATTGRYLFEAHVRGDCPHCGEESDGNACEQCGRPNDVSDLLNVKSKYGSGEVIRGQVERLYFKLSAFTEELKLYVNQVTMPAHLRKLCNSMLEEGLPDICVSNPTDWGINVPVPTYSEQRVYVWFEMAAGYLSSIAALNKTEQTDWKTFMLNPENRYVHFFGFDNGYFHALLIPAILMAHNKDVNLPAAFIVNELLNLDGLKFSTSRGHLIWAADMLKKQPADYLRFYLSYIRPESKKENFTLSAFEKFVEENIHGGILTMVDKITHLVYEDFSGVIPEAGAWSTEQISYFQSLGTIMGNLRQCYQLENFSPQNASYLLLEHARKLHNFIDAQIFFRGNKASYNHYRTSIALACEGLKIFAIAASPIMPNISLSLWKYLGHEGEILWHDEISLLQNCKAIKGLSFGDFHQKNYSDVKIEEDMNYV
nr:class I tRNA ligase family protein [Pantoea multigeneris]